MAPLQCVPLHALTPGRHDLMAVAGPYGGPRSEPQAVSIEHGRPSPPLTFRLEPRPVLRGTVAFPEDEAPESSEAMVHALRLAPGERADAERLAREGESDHVCASGPHFLFQDLVEGRYAVGLSRDTGPVMAMREVEVGAEMATMDLVLPPIDPREAVVVRVIGPSGSPFMEANVDPRWIRRSDTEWEAARSVKKADGTSWVIFTPEDRRLWDEGGELRLVVIGPERARKDVLVPRGTAEMTVRFADPALLELTIAGYAGCGLVGRVELDLYRLGDGFEGERAIMESMKPGADGRARFKPAEPGEYEVALEVEAAGEGIPAAVQRVSLRSGENRATMTIPPLHSVTVVFGRAGRALLGPSGEAVGPDWGAFAPVDSTGRVTFERLPAGTYTVGFAEHGYMPEAEMTLEVPGPAVVRFEPEPRDALLVRVTAPSGYLATIGFLDRDLVIEAGGVELQRAPSIDLLRLVTSGSRKLDLTVLRGGATLTIRADIERLASGEDLGGSIRPASRR